MGSAPSPGEAGPPVAIGADLGGTKMLVGVVAEGPKVLHRVEEVSFGRSAEEVLDTMEAELRAALDAHPEAGAAGLGIPCTIDQERGLAISAVNLPIVDVPIRDLMSERLGIPVVLDNDGNTAALAEHRWGAARGATNAVLLTIGTGIGGGLIIDGKVYRGSTGAGAELGHMVIDTDGPPCQGNCPNNGCAEAVASGTALGREAQAAAERHPESALGKLLADGEEVNGRAATAAAIAGDEVATRRVRGHRPPPGRLRERPRERLRARRDRFRRRRVWPPARSSLSPIREEVERRSLPPMNRTRIAHAELGPEAGMIGAATMAMDVIDQ